MWDHGSRRMLQQIIWLSQHTDLRLIPLQDGDSPNALDTSLTCNPDVEVADAVRLPKMPPWSHALPGLWAERHPAVTGMAGTVGQPEWLLVANSWVVGAPWLRELAGAGSVISWDGDAMSTWHLSAARAHLPNLRRSSVRLAAGLSLMELQRRRMSRLDLLTVPSTADTKALGRALRPLALVVPNTVPPTQAQDCPTCVADVLFVGSNYGPNLHGMQWFLERVWPVVVGSRPSTTLHLVGNGLTPDLFGAAAKQPGLSWHGRVDTLSGHLRGAGLVISPTFYGSGTPNKVVEAVAAGVPVLTTPFVLRRLPGLGLEARSRPADWTRAIVEELNRPSTCFLADKRRALADHGDSAFDTAMHRVLTTVQRKLSRP